MNPRYRLTAPLYADDTLFPEGTEIEFAGPPNEYMEPLNPEAEAKLTAYLQGLEEGRVASGRISRRLEDIVFQEMANRPKEDHSPSQIVMPKYNPDVAAMGNMTKNGGMKKPAVGEVKVLPNQTAKRPDPVVIGAAKDLINA